MTHDDLQALRIAVHGDDHADLVRIMSGEARRDALQLVGDALVAAVADGVAGAGFNEDGGRIDLQTGEVWRASTIEYFTEEEPEQAPDFADPDRWLHVSPEGSDEGYRGMEDFIAAMDDVGRADRLAIAIDGRGAFRRFKDTISQWPDEQERWYRFSDERRRGRAREWLFCAGHRVAPKHPETAPQVLETGRQ